MTTKMTIEVMTMTMKMMNIGDWGRGLTKSCNESGNSDAIGHLPDDDPHLILI